MSQSANAWSYRGLALAACLTIAAVTACAQDTISTDAGNGQATYSGDGGMAINAALNYPKGVAFDSAGNLYVADAENFRVRRVTPAGMISTVAGNGVNAYSGDGGQALAASLSDVTGVAVDQAGNLYIADDSNRVIRKVNTSGIITTIAGVGGVQGYSGDGGPASAAMLGRAVALAIDATGNLYYADSVNQVIRKIDLNGIITTVAGNGVSGFSGDGGAANAASLAFPLGVTVDSNDNIYIADANNNRVRKVSGGIITTVAGNGSGTFAGDGGQAVNASLNIPADVAVDFQGNLYVADAGNNRVREVSQAGVISTIAGTDDNGYSGDGGPGTSAMMNYPWGLAISTTGGLYVGDRVNNRVRVLSGVVSTNNITPVLASTSPVVNGASFLSGVAIAPGAIVSIFGSNLATGTMSNISSPLAESLDGTSVLFNGNKVPLFFVSQNQINAQVPFNLPSGQVQVQVVNGSATSAAASVPVAQFSPGIFVVDYTANTGAIIHTSNYSVVTPSNPAKPGESLAIFATGLGPVNMSIASGVAAPSVPPFAMTVNAPTVTVAGINASVPFSGLAPGYVGLYQLNFVVPTTTPAGTQNLEVSVGGAMSNFVYLAVQ
jgi:uncharacterized protein (TIGR03437 family)